MTPFEQLEQKREKRRSAIRAKSIAEKQGLSILPDLNTKIANLNAEIAELEATTKAATDLVSRFSAPIKVNENTTLTDLYSNKRKINADLAAYVDSVYGKQQEALRASNEATKQALGSAQASESAIQNANLSRAGMSMQAGAESRNRNFLATQEAIANANNAFVNQENAIIDANLSKQLGLNQLNSADIDNYPREQILLRDKAKANSGVSNTAKYNPNSRLPNFSPQSGNKSGKDSTASTGSVPGTGSAGGSAATNSTGGRSALEDQVRTATSGFLTSQNAQDLASNIMKYSINPLGTTVSVGGKYLIDLINKNKKAAAPAAKATKLASNFFI